jgi:hypothetical protein
MQRPRYENDELHSVLALPGAPRWASAQAADAPRVCRESAAARGHRRPAGAGTCSPGHGRRLLAHTANHAVRTCGDRSVSGLAPEPAYRMCGISRALQMSVRMTENRGVPGPSPVSPFNSPLDPSLFIGNPSGLPHPLDERASPPTSSPRPLGTSSGSAACDCCSLTKGVLSGSSLDSPITCALDDKQQYGRRGLGSNRRKAPYVRSPPGRP